MRNWCETFPKILGRAQSLAAHGGTEAYSKSDRVEAIRHIDTTDLGVVQRRSKIAVAVDGLGRRPTTHNPAELTEQAVEPKKDTLRFMIPDNESEVRERLQRAVEGRGLLPVILVARWLMLRRRAWLYRCEIPRVVHPSMCQHER
ncbi:MAG: hypothetical protein AAFO89_13305 [Planctomycetota bacterium]